MMDVLIDSNTENEMDAMDPFFMSLGDIVRQHIEWMNLLPNIFPFYAVKCNPDPVIISLLNYLGCSFDCVKHEFDLLLRIALLIQTINDIDDKYFLIHANIITFEICIGNWNKFTYI